MASRRGRKVAERDEADEAARALRAFGRQTETLRPPPGAKARLLARLGGGEAALEQFGAHSAALRPPRGASGRVLAAIEARGQRPVALRPRARLALAGVGLLLASSVGAMTLPNVASPFRLLPSRSPAPSTPVPGLGPASPRPAAAPPVAPPRPAAASSVVPAVGGDALPAIDALSPRATEATAPPAPATGPAIAPAIGPELAPAAAIGPEPAPAAASKGATGRSRPGAEGPAPDTLARQVGEYQRALSLAGRNDEAALAAWRSFRGRWPASPLRHEVDLQIVAALGRLGRRGELDAAARGFLREHPESPRSGDVRNMLRGGAKLASHG